MGDAGEGRIPRSSQGPIGAFGGFESLLKGSVLKVLCPGSPPCYQHTFHLWRGEERKGMHGTMNQYGERETVSGSCFFAPAAPAYSSIAKMIAKG